MNLFDFTLKKIDWWLLTSIWTLTNYTLRVLKIYDRSGYLDTKENFSTCDFSECTRRVLSIYCVFGAPIWIQILNHELEQSTHRALILTFTLPETKSVPPLVLDLSVCRTWNGLNHSLKYIAASIEPSSSSALAETNRTAMQYSNWYNYMWSH